MNKTEANYRSYFDGNAENLNPIEGIWTMNESGTWRNVYSGMTGSLPSTNAYRLAIVKDSTTPGYDFVAVVLESQYPNWTPGKIKARFRKTAYEKIVEGLWFMGDYSPDR